MKKNKEDGMTDLEIIKKNISLVTCKGQHCQSPRYDPVCIILSAATRMAAEIERLKAALAEKPDVVFCKDCVNGDKFLKGCINKIHCLKIDKVMDLYGFCSRGGKR